MTPTGVWRLPRDLINLVESSTVENLTSWCLHTRGSGADARRQGLSDLAARLKAMNEPVENGKGWLENRLDIEKEQVGGWADRVTAGVWRRCLRKTREDGVDAEMVGIGLDVACQLRSAAGSCVPPAFSAAATPYELRQALNDHTPTFSAVAHFPVRMNTASVGGVFELKVCRRPAAGDGPRLAVAPWSLVVPEEWTKFANSFELVGWDLLDRAAACVWPGGPPGTPAHDQFLFSFTPVCQATAPLVTLLGTSFGFAGLLGVFAAAHGLPLARTFFTGKLLSDQMIGQVDALVQKAWGVGRSRTPGRVQLFLPAKQTINRENPYADGDVKDVPTVAADIYQHCQEEHPQPIDIRDRVELTVVATWDDFFRVHLRGLIHDPFAGYAAQLANHQAATSEATDTRYWGELPDDSTATIAVAAFDVDPFPLAVRQAALALAAHTGSDIDRPVPLFVHLGACGGVQVGDTDLCVWLADGIRATAHHTGIELPSGDALVDRLRSRARLALVVFSDHSTENSYDEKRPEDQLNAILRYAEPSRLSVRFVASDSSHAEHIAEHIAARSPRLSKSGSVTKSVR